MDLAISAQLKQSEWPKDVNWVKQSAFKKASRERLAELYEVRLESSKSWNDAAQLGLLYLNTSNSSKAFKIWSQQLQKSPKGANANNASGIMIYSYNKRQDWDNLELITSIAIRNKLDSVSFGIRQNSKSLHSDALYNGGKKAYSSNDYDKAAEKFKKFTTLYKSDSRRADSMYLLTIASHKSGRHMGSIASAYEISKKYKSRKFHKNILLMAADWSQGMAMEKKSSYFYEEFLATYPKDTKVFQVKDNLAEIYMGRGLYGDAARTYLSQAKDRRNSKTKQLSYAFKHFQIEKKYGDRESSQISIDFIRKLADPESTEYISTRIYELELAVKDQHYPEIEKQEKIFSNLPLLTRDSSEALALARYTLAKHYAEEPFEEVFKLALKDPKKTIDNHYRHYLNIKKGFDSVCELRSNHFCAPAMLGIQKTSEDALVAINDIDYPSTLVDEKSEKFRKYKSTMISKIKEDQKYADAQANSRSKKGETSPEFSSAILLQTVDDWSFSQSSEDTGFGFVQWKPKRAH